MTECEKVINDIGNVLESFQSNLGRVASEILSLQKQAREGEKLKTIAADKQQNISNFINNLSLPDNLVQVLKEHTMDDTYIEYLKQFSTKTRNMDRHIKHEIKSIQELQPKFEDLTKVVCKRIHDWIMQKYGMAFKDLESLMAIHHQLIHFNFFFEFLLDNNPEVSASLINYYSTKANKLYYHKFKAICYQTQKIYQTTATKEDLIVFSGSIMSSLFQKSSTQKMNVFSLGNRLDYLVNLDQTSFFPSKIESKLPTEYLFRCIMFHMKEYVLEELYFSDSFLKSDISDTVLAKSQIHVLKLFEGLIENSFDMLGIMIKCVILKTYYKEIKSKYDRLPPETESFFTKLEELFAQRYNTIFQMNVESIQRTKPEVPIDVQPLLAVRRYGEFLRSCMTLITSYPHELKFLNINSKLKSLRYEIENFVSKQVGSFKEKEKLIMFFINNFNVMQASIQDFGETEHLSNFVTKLNGYVSQLADILLISNFGYIVKFVKENAVVDVNTNSVKLNDPTADPRYVEEILKKFYKSWKDHLKDINGLIMSHLGTNLRNGLGVLEVLSRDIVFYYKALLDIIRQHYKSLQNSTFIVSETEILYEMKSYLGQLGKINIS